MEGNEKHIAVLFGNIVMSDNKPADKYHSRIVAAYQKYESKLKSIGYTLKFGAEPYCSKNEFLKIISAPTTYAFVWHSHGNRMGQLSGGLGDVISPSDIKSVSENLQFAAIWGCDIQQSAFEWRRVLKLTKDRFPKDAEKRLASHPGGISEEDWGLGAGLAMVPPSIQFITVENRFYPYYTFANWIDLLPQKHFSFWD